MLTVLFAAVGGFLGILCTQAMPSAQREGSVPSSLTWCCLPSCRHTAQPGPVGSQTGGWAAGGPAFREEPPVRPLRMPSAGGSLGALAGGGSPSAPKSLSLS